MPGSSSQSVQIHQIDRRNQQITNGKILQCIHLQPFLHTDIEQQENHDIDSKHHREAVSLPYALQIERQRLPQKQEKGTEGIKNQNSTDESKVDIRPTEEITGNETIEYDDDSYKYQSHASIQRHHLHDLAGNLLRCLPAERK